MNGGRTKSEARRRRRRRDPRGRRGRRGRCRAGTRPRRPWARTRTASGRSTWAVASAARRSARRGRGPLANGTQSVASSSEGKGSSDATTTRRAVASSGAGAPRRCTWTRSPRATPHRAASRCRSRRSRRRGRRRVRFGRGFRRRPTPRVREHLRRDRRLRSCPSVHTSWDLDPVGGRRRRGRGASPPWRGEARGRGPGSRVPPRGGVTRGDGEPLLSTRKEVAARRESKQRRTITQMPATAAART